MFSEELEENQKDIFSLWVNVPAPFCPNMICIIGSTPHSGDRYFRPLEVESEWSFLQRADLMILGCNLARNIFKNSNSQ
jgi:hypothetical protein